METWFGADRVCVMVGPRGAALILRLVMRGNLGRHRKGARDWLLAEFRAPATKSSCRGASPDVLGTIHRR